MAKDSFKVNNSVNLKGQASAPSTPENGDIYYDSATNKFLFRQNGAWVELLSTPIDAANIGSGAVSNTEFGYLDGVTSAIQTQLDTKANRNLSNLLTTSINQDLLPSSNITRNLGSGSLNYLNVYTRNIIANGALGLFAGDPANQKLTLAGERIAFGVPNASDPGSPVERDFYFNSTSKKFRYYNGTAWRDVGVNNTANVGSSPNAAGLTIANDTINLQPASGSFPGVMLAGAQTIGGAKSWLGDQNLQSALEFDATNEITTSGSDVTISLPSKTVSVLSNNSLTSIAGIVAASNTRIIYLINSSTTNKTFKHQSTAASAANRLILGPGGDFVLKPGSGVALVYNTTASRWGLVSGQAGIETDTFVVEETFEDGVDFTAGSSTSITVANTYVQEANLFVYFDGVPQLSDAFTLSGNTLTFSSAIPSGVSKIYIKAIQVDVRTSVFAVNETFVNGVNFTAGSSTSITLNNQYETESNLAVFFDGVFQGPDTYSLSGTTLTFDAAIPGGVSKIYIKALQTSTEAVSSDNLIINGDFAIAQRGDSFTGPVHAAYTLDRWQYLKAGAMVHNITRDPNDTPTVEQAGYKLRASYRLNLTTPDTSIAAGDYCGIQQIVEGFNFAKIAQKPFTVSFWVKSTLTGTFHLAFRNSGGDRSIVKSYTINSANTWEKKIITVEASPSAGTWNYTNGNGLHVRFILAAGSNYHAPNQTWQTTNNLATSSQTNGVNTGFTDFRIAGVMLNEGTTAKPFQLAGKSFGNEIALCQRYYEKSYSLESPPGTINASGAVWLNQTGGLSVYNDVRFATQKRAAPTVAAYSYLTGSGGTGGSAKGRNFSTGADFTPDLAPAGIASTTDAFVWNTEDGSEGDRLSIHWVADAELT